MKIAILTSGILPVPAVQGGAVEALVDYLLEYNNKHSLHDITVYSVFNPAVCKEKALQSDVNHYVYINTGSLVAKARKRLHGLTASHPYYHYSIDYFFTKTLRSICQQHYDIIILENRPGFALKLQGKTDAKLVYHLHNDFLNDTTQHGAALYQLATRIITVSDFIRGRVQTCNPQDAKTFTVHNGTDLAPFAAAPTLSRTSLGMAPDDFILIFSGRLVQEKGIMELVEAMRRLSDYPKIKLLVMGSSFYGNAKDDTPFIQKLKSLTAACEDRIRFTGFVQHDLMADYLRLADVAMIPSTWNDPFPTTVLEGMAAGLPLITTDRGGIPEIVTSQNAIILPYPGDLADSLAKAILSLYHDPERKCDMGGVSKQLSLMYSKESYAKNFFDAIEDLHQNEERQLNPLHKMPKRPYTNG